MSLSLICKIKDLDLTEKILWFFLILIITYMIVAMSIGIIASQKKIAKYNILDSRPLEEEVPLAGKPIIKGFTLTIYNFSELSTKNQVEELQNDKNKQ